MPTTIFSPASQSLMGHYKAAGYSVWYYGFDFEKGDGNYYDGAGNEDTGRLYYVNGKMLKTNGPLGVGGFGVQADTEGDYLRAVSEATANITNTNFTIAFWVRPIWTGVTTNSDIVLSKSYDASNPGYSVSVTDGSFYTYCWDANGQLNHPFSYAFTQGAWYHIALAYTNVHTGGVFGKGSLSTSGYVNGSLITTRKTDAISQIWNLTSGISSLKIFESIGTNYGSHDVDDLWIITKALDATEVGELYNSID